MTHNTKSEPRNRLHIVSISDLRDNVDVDPVTRCWIWRGLVQSDGMPIIYTIDYARGEKRCMSGPRAAWNIAHGRAPLPGWLVFRACGCLRCVNPVHLREARNRKEIGRHIALAGWRKGTHVEKRAANAALGRLALGIVDTPADIVREILAAPASETHTSIAARLSMSTATVCDIRNGKRRRGVGASVRGARL